jgi:hypothetical protein
LRRATEANFHGCPHEVEIRENCFEYNLRNLRRNVNNGVEPQKLMTESQMVLAGHFCGDLPHSDFAVSTALLLQLYL